MSSDAALKNLKMVQDVLDTLRAKLATKREEHCELSNASHAARTAPPDKEFAEQVLNGVVDSLCAANLQALREQLVPWLGDIHRIQNRTDRQITQNIVSLIASGRIHHSGVYALLGPALKAGIKPALAAMDWPAGAIDEATREKTISDLEPKLKANRQAREELEEQLSQLGLK